MLRTLLIFMSLGSAWAVDSSSTPLTAERIRPAILKALGDTASNVEIVDISSFPAPAGEVEFLLKDLNPPASVNAPTRWRGFVHDGDQHTFAIWAMVRINAPCKRVVATQTLEVGKPILATQVREEDYLGFPFGKYSPVTLEKIVGRAPLRTVRSGSPVQLDVVSDPMAVANGDSVIAEFHSGLVRISAPVIALGSGRVGATISVRNPTSKKIFAAKIDSPGRVIVEFAQ